MGGIDGILRRAVQADFKLGLDRSLECFTLAHEWLRAEHIEDAGKGDIVPIDVLQNLVEVFNQVFADSAGHMFEFGFFLLDYPLLALLI